MSSCGRSERVERLRADIARIETDGTGAVGFGLEAPRRVGLGRDVALDRVLRGGLPQGALTEVVAAQAADAGAATGFALALAVRFAEGRKDAPVVWILEDGAGRESGLPYAPGLAAHGVRAARLVVVRTASGGDSLWAMEEALKCRAVAAVVTDLWRTKAYDLVASRRLVLAAGRSGTPGVLVAAGAPGSAAALSSAAQVRFEVGAGASRALASADRRAPLPGAAAWRVRLARIRAGPTGAAPFDGTKLWPLVWDHEEARFCDALPLPAPALPRDGSNPAAMRAA